MESTPIFSQDAQRIEYDSDPDHCYPLQNNHDSDNDKCYTTPRQIDNEDSTIGEDIDAASTSGYRTRSKVNLEKVTLGSYPLNNFLNKRKKYTSTTTTTPIPNTSTSDVSCNIDKEAVLTLLNIAKDPIDDLNYTNSSPSSLMIDEDHNSDRDVDEEEEEQEQEQEQEQEEEEEEEEEGSVVSTHQVVKPSDPILGITEDEIIYCIEDGDVKEGDTVSITPHQVIKQELSSPPRLVTDFTFSNSGSRECSEGSEKPSVPVSGSVLNSIRRIPAKRDAALFNIDIEGRPVKKRCSRASSLYTFNQTPVELEYSWKCDLGGGVCVEESFPRKLRMGAVVNDYNVSSQNNAKIEFVSKNTISLNISQIVVLREAIPDMLEALEKASNPDSRFGYYVCRLGGGLHATLHPKYPKWVDFRLWGLFYKQTTDQDEPQVLNAGRVGLHLYYNQLNILKKKPGLNPIHCVVQRRCPTLSIQILMRCAWEYRSCGDELFNLYSKRATTHRIQSKKNYISLLISFLFCYLVRNV